MRPRWRWTVPVTLSHVKESNRSQTSPLRRCERLRQRVLRSGLVTGCYKTARLWHLRLNELMDLARRTLGRESADGEMNAAGPSSRPR